MIKINAVGVISSGGDSGYQVKILDNSENTGGFLVLIAKNFNVPKTEVLDDWVQDKKALMSYIEGSSWVIK